MKPGVMWLVATNRQTTVRFWGSGSLYSRINHLFCSTRPIKAKTSVLHKRKADMRSVCRRHPVGLGSTHKDIGPRQQELFFALTKPWIIEGFCFLSPSAFSFSHKFRPKYFLFLPFLSNCKLQQRTVLMKSKSKPKMLFYGLTVKIMGKEHADTERCVLLQTLRNTNTPADALTTFSCDTCGKCELVCFLLYESNVSAQRLC